MKVDLLQSPNRIDVHLTVDPAGERMPPVYIVATGGPLDCYKSDVHTSGNINLHVFGEGEARLPPVLFRDEDEMERGMPRIGGLVDRLFARHPRLASIGVSVGVNVAMAAVGLELSFERSGIGDPEMAEVLQELH